MKQADIKIGETYQVKVAGNLVPVQITEAHPSGTGWLGKSVKTGKPIVIRSAQRIHSLLGGDTAKPVATRGKSVTKATTDTTGTPKRDTGNPWKRVATDAKPMSLINAAARILAQGNRDPMRCKEIVEQAISQNLWQPGKGLTPSATLHAAIAHEIKTKGDASRFRKAERGKFTVTAQD